MKENVDISIIQKIFVEKGVWVRPFGKLIYIMPPFMIAEKDLNYLTSTICDVIENYDF